MAEPNRGPGRTAKISREAIAAAVIEIGFDDATVKNVAHRLGISVPGLYHHVRGRDDLLRIASESLLATHQLPPDTGQPWPEWLRAVGWSIRTRLAHHPELVGQYISGVEMPEGITHLEDALEVLSRFDFSPISALNAFQAIGQVALGAAADDVREQELVQSGRATIALFYGALARDPTGLPRLRELLSTQSPEHPDQFDNRLTLVLMGVAAARHESWEHAIQTHGRPPSRPSED
jgi:AcrR family transcriptional regulator